MKNFTSTICFVAILLVNSSCKKETTTPTLTPVTPTPTAVAFSWQEDGGTALVADSAFWTTGAWGTGIRAYKSGDFFELNWSTQNNTSVGTKILEIPYGFTFLKGSATYTCASNQNLAITANASSTLSGNFNVPVSGGSITTISATFTNLSQH